MKFPRQVKQKPIGANGVARIESLKVIGKKGVRITPSIKVLGDIETLFLLNPFRKQNRKSGDTS